MKLSPSFDLSEFACHDGTPVPPELVPNVERLVLGVLQPLRDRWGPLAIVSGYRTPAYNARIGGAKDSTHMTGQGADVRPTRHKDMLAFARDVLALYRAGKLPALGGMGRYTNWVHLDVRRAPDGHLRTWRGKGVGSEK